MTTTRSLWMLLAFALLGPAWGAEPAGPDATAAVTLNHREILSFAAPLGGESAEQRARRAEAALQSAAAQPPAPVTLNAVGSALRLDVGGQPAFFVLDEDLGSAGRPDLREAGAQKVRARLEQALAEAREARDPQALARGALWALGATLLAGAALWALLAGARRLHSAVVALARRWRAAGAPGGITRLVLRPLPTLAAALLALLKLALVLLLLELWGSTVLRQFAYTRPWGEAASHWLSGMAGQALQATAAALPGLLTAVLIFVAARLLTRGFGVLADEAERGELQLAWLHPDTAAATRRIASVAVWLFALAIAYPHLPGSQSESFKGVTVLAGLMLSLGASGVVGQAMAGLTLTYSRALRPGEYVRVGDAEGTVTAVGLFVTKVQTGLGEEVSLPNATVMSQPIRNFSRLVPDGQFMLQAGVTIGYATPWRQVHALLLEAARRTQGVADDPAPYVVQTALSDFYVEYRLCAYGDRSAPRRRAEALSQLNGHIQDVFNESGVQIMSPHYRGDPPAPQVVNPGAWFQPAQGPLQPPPQA